VTQKPITAIKVWRSLFIAVLVFFGGYAGYEVGFLALNRIPIYRETVEGQQPYALIAFTLLGVFVTYLLATAAFNKLVQTGDRLKEMPANEKVSTFVGVMIGLLVTWLVSQIFLSQIAGHARIAMTVISTIAFVYLAVVATSSMKDDLRLYLPGGAGGPLEDPNARPDKCKILDTNVIIDGRVADICRTGFLDGPIYVPGFVLDELQHIADSSDALKRARGRRGLDILNQMRTEHKMLVRTYDNTDPNDRDEVDAKLVKLAKELNGMIVTNDFNLNKVAELQGVQVLNINELANALKPVVLPGEEMTVTIIKEGKEPNQGVAYLEDGTMIVVEGARRRIGESLEVITSSVLQTVAGKMIFASIRSAQQDEEEEDALDQNLRNYPRGGPRRKIQH
jgi:uncharacterized protein YacL